MRKFLFLLLFVGVLGLSAFSQKCDAHKGSCDSKCATVKKATVKIPELTPEQIRIRDSKTKNFSERQGKKIEKALPSEVRNFEKPYFRDIWSQCCCCCGQASGTAYIYTYEINCLRDEAADDDYHRYPSHYTWNFLNGGASNGTWPYHGWDIIETNGVPTVADFGFNCGDATYWMSGYEKYYRGMFNRVKQRWYVDVTQPGAIEDIKEWMYDHGKGDPAGGICNFTSDNGSLASHDGWTVISYNGNMEHAMTLVGYDDNFSYGGSTGCFYMANSYGTDWGTNGFARVMYNNVTSGGFYDNRVEFVEAKEHTPLLTFKINMTHSSRGNIRIRAGFADNENASSPEEIITNNAFNYNGGSHPMRGEGNNSAIEIGLDVTEFMSFITDSKYKVFLMIDSNSGSGEVISFSVLDYTGAEVIEIPCTQSNVNISNGQTILSIVKDANFDPLKIETTSLPTATYNTPYSYQLTASGGYTPYTWEAVVGEYTESTTGNSFPAITSTKLNPATNDDDVAQVNLPFTFPFFGEDVNTVWVSTDGSILFNSDFAFIRSEAELANNKAISALGIDMLFEASDGDAMYYSGGANSATFRWKTSNMFENPGVNIDVAATLYPSGEIEFFYGAGLTNNLNEMIIGVSNGVDNKYVNAAQSTTDIPDYYKFKLIHPDVTPPGMALSSGGVLSGTPTENNKTWNLTFKVTDQYNTSKRKTLPFTVSGTIDNEPPSSPSSLSSSNVTQTSVQLSWNASTDNVGVTGYDIYEGSSVTKSVSGTTTSTNITGLAANTSYSFRIRAKDAASNVSGYSNTENVTTLSDNDTEPPSDPSEIAVDDVTQTSITISWTASVDNVGVAGYDLYLDGALVSTTINTNYTFTGLTCGTTYQISVRAKDAAGNVSGLETITAATLACGCNYCSLTATDQGYEWITGVTVGSFSKTSGKENGGYSDFTSETINLTAGASTNITLTPNNTQYAEHFKIWIDYNGDCDFEDSGEEVFSGSAKGNTTGAINVPSGLNITTRIRIAMQYNAAPPSYCGSYQYGEVEDYTVKITGGGEDTQAPSVPTGLASSNVTQTSVNLSWNASTDNVGVTGYDVLQNGSVVESPTGTTATVSGLTAGTTYSFTVRAKDAAGNLSGVGSAISVTTQQGSDTEPPTAPSNLTSTGKTQNSVSLSWGASTDNVGVEEYRVYNGGNLATTVSGTSATVVSLLAGTSYTFTVTARDAAGNESGASNSATVTTEGGGTLPTYCDAQSNDGPEHIARFQFAGIDNSSARDNYHDYTSIEANVSKGSSYTASVTIGQPYNNDNEATVYIDWNIDGDFDDPGEKFSLSKSSDSEASLSIAVPSSASTGLTGVRVKVSYYDDQDVPCGNNSYGEVEDYAVNISGGAKTTLASMGTEVIISPNPTDGIVKVETNKEGAYPIVVTNLIGTVVKIVKGEGPVSIIDLSDFLAGTYIINVDGNSKKIIKK